MSPPRTHPHAMTEKACIVLDVRYRDRSSTGLLSKLRKVILLDNGRNISSCRKQCPYNSLKCRLRRFDNSSGMHYPLCQMSEAASFLFLFCGQKRKALPRLEWRKDCA